MRITLTWLVPLALLAIGCGDVLYDQNQRQLILDPVDRVSFDVDNGGVSVFAYNRTAVSILYYMRGSDSQINDVQVKLDKEKRAIHAYIDCVPEPTQCIADFTADVPLGTGIDAFTRAGDLNMTSVDGRVKATIGGSVNGILMRSRDVDLEVSGGDVSLVFDQPPDSVTIVLDEGLVDITVPAGSYRCDLATDDGEVTTTGVTCDDAAPSSLSISVGSGDITLQVAS